METKTTGSLLTTTTQLPRYREAQIITDVDKLLLAPFGRRNKMRIEGHRGMGRYEPENTFQSFARSIDEELDGIELDVWLSKDKIPVVIHADIVDDVDGYIFFDNGSKRLVYEMTLKEIRSQKILNGNTVPLLDEVFRLTKDKICVNVEFKGEDLNGALAVLKLCKAHNNFDQVQFSSFNWKFAEALDTVRESLNIQVRPPFGFLTEQFEITEAFTIGKSGDGVTFGWDEIQQDKEKFKGIAKEIIKNGFRLKVYFSFSHQEIYNDYDVMETFEVDTLITNEPFLLKRYYEQKAVEV